jgi:hypothetical protein
MSKNCAVVSDTGIVLNIVVCHDDEPESANLIRYEDTNPAYMGGTFDTGYFYPPQPYPSWTRSEGQWVAPVSVGRRLTGVGRTSRLTPATNNFHAVTITYQPTDTG